MVDEREQSDRWEVTARTLRPFGPRSDYHSLNATFPRSWTPTPELEWMVNDYTAVHYATTIPGRYAPILRWMSQAYRDLTALSRVNRRRAQETASFGQWYMACRALSGLCMFIAEFGGDHVYPSEPARQARAGRELDRRATQLGEAVNAHRERFVDPVRTFRPQTIADQERLADSLWTKLQDTAVPPLMRRLATDGDVGVQQRELVGSIYAMIFADGVSEIANTSRHQNIVEACDRAMSAADRRIREIVAANPDLRSPDRQRRIRKLDTLTVEASNGLETAAVVGGLLSGMAGNATGNMPLGTDSATLSYARVVVSWRVLRGATLTESWLVERFNIMVHATGNIDQAATQTLEQAARHGDEVSVNRAHDILSERFQVGAKFNLVATAFSIFQVAFIWLAASQRAAPPTGRDVFDASVAVAQAGSAVIYTIARLGEQRAVPVALESVVFTARSLRAVIAQVDALGSTVLAVVAIADGYNLWAEGEATQNMVTQGVGVITAGSGACIAIATIANAFELAGVGAVFGPIGVALGLVAGIVAVVVAVRYSLRPVTVRVFEQLVTSIGNHDAHDEEHAALRQISEKFDRLLSWMRDHYNDVDYTFARHGTAADNRRMRRGLFALGFDERTVNVLCPYEHF